MTPDKAHRDTDRELAALGRRVRSVYREAQQDVQAKMDAFTARHEAKDKDLRKQLADGEITQSQYRAWQQGQVFQGKQWKAKLDQITTTLNNANVVAQGIINGRLNGVFANNANWQSYLLERGAGINFGFSAYDADTVARLLRDEPELLPKSRVNIPKDKRWNQKIITQQIAQGVIQGESIAAIGKRMEQVTDRNKNLSLTRARTAMTGAENAGRQESLTRAKGKGIKVKKEWVSTLDGRTRHSHRLLDGQKVDLDQDFDAEGFKIRFPGDPQAHPAMVYNCRCTMVGDLEDYPDEYNAQRYDNIDGVKVADMSYSDWEKAKQSGQQIPSRREKPSGAKIRVPVKPKRPRRSSFQSEEDYETARDQYKEDRAQYEKQLEDLVNSNTPQRTLSREQLEDWCTTHDVKIYGDVDPVDPRLLTAWTERYEQLATEFPSVRREWDKFAEYNISFEDRHDCLFSAETGMNFGASCRNAEDVLRQYYEDVGEGYLVAGRGDYRALFDHEFGHNLHSSIKMRYWYKTESGDVESNTTKIVELSHDIRASLLDKKGVSEYATTNDNELFAEAFAEWHSGSNSDLAKAFGELLKRWL